MVPQLVGEHTSVAQTRSGRLLIHLWAAGERVQLDRASAGHVDLTSSDELSGARAPSRQGAWDLAVDRTKLSPGGLGRARSNDHRSHLDPHGLASDAASGGRFTRTSLRRVTAVAAMLIGALAGALLLRQSLAAPLAVAAVLLILATVGFVLAGERRAR
jgi:Protein of unknown function (DUF1275)